MFYLQYNKSLAEHFPRREISQGRTLFAALSFLWQPLSRPTPNTVLQFCKYNHNSYLNGWGPKSKILHRRTHFVVPSFPWSPLPTVPFASLSLKPNANPTCAPHKAPVCPALSLFSLTQESLRVELSSSCKRRQDQAFFRGIQWSDKKQRRQLADNKFQVDIPKYFS